MPTLTGKTLSATRTRDTLEDALYGVMEVIERELHDFRDVRRGIVQAPGPQEVYFHTHSVQRIPFEKLHVDMVVDLDIETGHRAPQASRMTPRLLQSPGPIEAEDRALEKIVFEVVADTEQAAQQAARALGFPVTVFAQRVRYYNGAPHDLIVMER